MPAVVRPAHVRDRDRFWHTELYEVREGRWQAVWSQATRIQTADPRGQLTAFFTRSPMRFSSADVSFVSAQAVGHMEPSSRFASALKPKDA